MVLLKEIILLLNESLGLRSGREPLTKDTMLIGGIPEFDSLAVVSVVNKIEEKYEITIEDEELTAEVFQTVGTLCEFVERKLQA